MVQDKRILTILDDLKLDAILVSNGFNMKYISGFSGATGYVYFSRKKKIIFTDSRYTIQAEQESPDYQVKEIYSDYPEAIGELIKEESIGQLGFEAKDLLHSDYLELKEKLKVDHLTPVLDEITNLRSIKTSEELELIKHAEGIGDIAFEQILNIIKPGMTELEIAAHLEFIMKTNGAEGLSFDTIVASGINSSMPHAVPTNKKIEQGDFITMDFGCRYQGYCSDMTRTIVVGKANAEQKKIYNTVLNAQNAALDFIKAGYQGKEIDQIARNYIHNAGYEGCFGHGLGHGVGLFIHEGPRLSPKEDGLILANMVETVEPGIYIKGFGGVRIEDVVAITEDGCINYTKSEKKLIEL
jgi:Xaa-Pro aminopeptidase